MRIALSVLVGVLFSASAASAQQLQAGAAYTLLSLSYPDQIPNGFGGWVSWDFEDVQDAPALVIGLDAALNFFPGNDPIIGRHTQLLGGLRGGVRTDLLGTLGRLRLGPVKFTERFLAPHTACIAIFPPPEACLVEGTNLAVDAGVTFELYATRRSVVRVDAGDTIIRFQRAGRDSWWTHNFQFTAGAGLRF